MLLVVPPGSATRETRHPAAPPRGQDALALVVPQDGTVRFVAGDPGDDAVTFCDQLAGWPEVWPAV